MLYNNCALFEQEGFVYPTFRCPVRTITTKRDGINDFMELELTAGYCEISPTAEEAADGQLATLNPDDESCFSLLYLPE